MKKIIAILLTVAMVFSLVACGSELPSKANNETPAEKPLNDTLENKPSKGDTAEKETRPPEPETTPIEEVAAPATEPILEEIDMGEAGEAIYLSELQIGTTYLYHLNEVQEQYYATVDDDTTGLNLTPHIINDTEHAVVNVTVQVDDMEPLKITAFNQTIMTYVPLAGFMWKQIHAGTSERAKTLRVTACVVEIEDVLDENEMICLSNYEAGSLIDMGWAGYLFNNTESIVVVRIESESDNFTQDFELFPDDVLETTSLYEAKIIEIKR